MTCSQVTTPFACAKPAPAPATSTAHALELGRLFAVRGRSCHASDDPRRFGLDRMTTGITAPFLRFGSPFCFVSHLPSHSVFFFAMGSRFFVSFSSLSECVPKKAFCLMPFPKRAGRSVFDFCDFFDFPILDRFLAPSRHTKGRKNYPDR